MSDGDSKNSASTTFLGRVGAIVVGIPILLMVLAPEVTFVRSAIDAFSGDDDVDCGTVGLYLDNLQPYTEDAYSSILTSWSAFEYEASRMLNYLSSISPPDDVREIHNETVAFWNYMNNGFVHDVQAKLDDDEAWERLSNQRGAPMDAALNELDEQCPNEVRNFMDSLERFYGVVPGTQQSIAHTGIKG